jgi:hypothetical protein
VSFSHYCRPNTGGAGRDRTGDLLSANQALSQLSYSPFLSPAPSPSFSGSPGAAFEM